MFEARARRSRKTPVDIFGLRLNTGLKPGEIDDRRRANGLFNSSFLTAEGLPARRRRSYGAGARRHGMS
jgi:hypothetical protein